MQFNNRTADFLEIQVDFQILGRIQDDILRDQAEALSDRLVAAGNDVRRRLGAGMLHDFVILPGLFDRASTAADDVCAELRLAFGAGS